MYRSVTPRTLLAATLVWLGLAAKLHAQDTFSLLAFDPATGEIASAGASCVDGNALPGGCARISSVWPGRGAVHTQSFYLPENQATADSLLLAGSGAEALLSELLRLDAKRTPALRQYIALSTTRSAVELAAYTGGRCYAYAGQLRGANFAVAGNVLLDSTVLRRMSTAYQAAVGAGAWIGDAALLALRAVAYPGADQRCLSAGISSRSAFLRVARPDDARDSLYLDLVVEFPVGGRDPIDTLTDSFAAWRILHPESAE